MPNALHDRLKKLSIDPKLDNLSFKFYVKQLWWLMGFLAAIEDLDEWGVRGIDHVLDLMELEALNEVTE